jgi:hypothetical protein
MAGYSSASWAKWCARNGCITKDTPPPFDLPSTTSGYTPKDPSTRYSDQGVIPIDNTLIDRDRMLIPDAGWYWDHAEQRNKIAQDYLFVNYVCTSGKHYPLEFRLFRK